MTGTNWNGHRFFGLSQGKIPAADVGADHRKRRNRAAVCRANSASGGDAPPRRIRRPNAACVARSIRASRRDQGLEQDFNSLDAQRKPPGSSPSDPAQPWHVLLGVDNPVARAWASGPKTKTAGGIPDLPRHGSCCMRSPQAGRR
jgi:hypothetical protein